MERSQKEVERISLRMEPEYAINLDYRLVWLVRSWPTPSPGFRLKVAEIHDVYMVVSGVSVCEEVHPCKVIIIYSNSRVCGKGLLGCLYSS